MTMSDIHEIISQKLRESVEEIEKKTALHRIHASNAAYICRVAEKLKKNSFNGGDWQEELTKEVEVPVQEKWDFELGDQIRIKYTLPEFKEIQKKTTGWSKNMRLVVNKNGFIINICNEYDPHVLVYFPKIGLKCELYVGVLEKIHDSSIDNSKGKVISINSGRAVAEILQRGFDDIPESYLTKKGKVVKATDGRVFVTFEGTIAIDMNPALLQFEESSEMEKLFKQPTNEEGKFKIGDKVKLIPNLKKVIEQQKEHGGWNIRMNEMLKGDVTVLLIKEDTLRVCDHTGYTHNFNANSLLQKKDENPEEDNDEDVPFKIGDQVRVKHVPDIRKILKEKDIPLSIVEFLQFPGKISSYDDRLRAEIEYNCEYKVYVDCSVLERVPDETAGQVCRSDAGKSIKSWAQGEKVHLNVGPPNYVRDVLKKIGASNKVITALTTSAVIQGFKGPNHVIIKYEKDQYKVNKKHLTSPSTFNIQTEGKERKFQWENVEEVTTVVRKCLDVIQDEFKDSEEIQLDHGVNAIYLVDGRPPMLDLKIKSPIATYENLMKTLQENSGWNIEKICDGLIYVKKLPKCECKLQIKFSINEEERQIIKYVKAERDNQSEEKIEEFGNAQPLKASFEPQGYQPPGYLEPYEPQSDVNLTRNFWKRYQRQAGQERNLREGDLGSGIPTSLHGFKLMQLNDESLNRTILFPYLLIGGNTRQPASSINIQNQVHSTVNFS